MHVSECLKLKILMTQSVDKVVGQLELSYASVGTLSVTITSENGLAGI